MGPQQRRLGFTEVEVEGVPHAPGRVRRRHVEGAEVVPVRLHLGTLGDDEAHADEDVLQRRLGLAHQVQVAPGRRGHHVRRDHLGEVQAVVGQPLAPLLVELASGLPTGVGLESAERTVGQGQGRLLAEDRRLDGAELRRRSGTGDLVRRRLLEGTHVDARAHRRAAQPAHAVSSDPEVIR